MLARIGATGETNRRIGYDVATWIEEELCDMVATNANSGTDPDVDVEVCLEMMAGTPAKLYPGFDSHGEWGTGHLLAPASWPAAWFRGLAQGYYERGAAGVHVVRSLLETVGSPDTLRGTDKVFAAVKQHGGHAASCATVPSGTTACRARSRWSCTAR